MIKKNVVSTEKWGECLEITNDKAQLLLSLDFGPRGLLYKLKEGENVFFEDPERTVYFDDPSIGEYYKDRNIWYNFGGHRLWINPEKMPQTFHPDTDKVAYQLTDKGAIVHQMRQIPNELELSIEFIMDEVEAKLQVIHRVKNTADIANEFAIWCISPMAPGGMLIVPMGELEDGAAPNRSFATWPYTDLTDSRLYIGKNFLTLLQEPGNTYNPVNLGYNNPLGVAGYLNNGTLFIDRFDSKDGGNYPDRGSAFETYSDENFMEVESLGELKVVQPGETVEHIENWELVKADDAFEPRDEETLQAFAEKYM